MIIPWWSYRKGGNVSHSQIKLQTDWYFAGRKRLTEIWVMSGRTWFCRTYPEPLLFRRFNLHLNVQCFRTLWWKHRWEIHTAFSVTDRRWWERMISGLQGVKLFFQPSVQKLRSETTKSLLTTNHHDKIGRSVVLNVSYICLMTNECFGMEHLGGQIWQQTGRKCFTFD